MPGALIVAADCSKLTVSTTELAPTMPTGVKVVVMVPPEGILTAKIKINGVSASLAGN